MKEDLKTTNILLGIIAFLSFVKIILDLGIF